jgi:hypothetical protein
VDAAGAGVSLRVLSAVGRSCRASQKERTPRNAVVDGASDRVPERRDSLPFIEQYRAVARESPPGIRLGDLPLCGLVQADNRRSAPLGGRGLADALRALQGERWESTHQLVQLVVDRPVPVVLHAIYATKWQMLTLLFVVNLQYHQSATWATV